MVALFAPLLLAVCTAAPTEVRWVKTGADDKTIARELQDCNAQADAALATERGINQDINATLGGNWQRSGTLGTPGSGNAPTGFRFCRSGAQQLHARQGLHAGKLIAKTPVR